MGFLLRENSYLLKCYPTIKVFCGLAVKQRGPEVEITGFSFWLRHKFPLSELWARAFITACVTLAVPLWGTWMCPSGKLLSLHDVTELSQTWCVCCVCEVMGEPLMSKSPCTGKYFSSAPHQVCESLSCGTSWAVSCPALGTADGANAAWDFPEL